MALRIIGFALLHSRVLGDAPEAMCREGPHGPFNSSTFLLNRRPLLDADAVCNDGSQAQIYFRPCCNGYDSGDFCNQSDATWFVVFGDGNQDGWCWDADSCAKRASESKHLTSSVDLPPTFNRSEDIGAGPDVGAFCKGGEANPNFYKAYAAYVPYCSSDLFLGECAEVDGDGASFCGKRIAKAAVKSLLPDMLSYGADQVVFVGGAGVMSFVQELAEMVSSTGAAVFAVCDGCLLFDGPSRPASCDDAFSCPAGQTLPAATALWGAAGASDWASLLAEGLLARVPIPVLARHPLYDLQALAALGAPGADDASLAEQLRRNVTASLREADVSVGPACEIEQSGFTKSTFLTEGQAALGAAAGAGGLYSKGLYTLLRGDGRGEYIDSCEGLGCNPSCDAPSQRVFSV